VTVIIREAAPADDAGIAAVHRAAFPTSAEAGLVAALMAGDDVLLSLVAERDGVVVGHLLFSRVDASADGRPVAGAALAPVAVVPERQGLGIGGGLIDQGLAMLAERGVALVFVLGDAGFYEQFGFDAALGARFETPYAGDHWLALALDDRRWPKRGAVRHAAAFAQLENMG